MKKATRAGPRIADDSSSLRGRGVEIAEGYPVKPARDGAPTPAAFAWTGTRRLFDACGFAVVGNPDGGKQRVRKLLA